MSSAMDQRFILKYLDPFRNMADLAIFFAQMADNCLRVLCFNMQGPRAMTNLAPCIFKMRSLLLAYKSSRLSVTGGMTRITLFYLLRGKMFHLLLDTFKRCAFFGIGHKIIILFRMAFPAGQ